MRSGVDRGLRRIGPLAVATPTSGHPPQISPRQALSHWRSSAVSRAGRSGCGRSLGAAARRGTPHKDRGAAWRRRGGAGIGLRAVHRTLEQRHGDSNRSDAPGRECRVGSSISNALFVGAVAPRAIASGSMPDRSLRPHDLRRASRGRPILVEQRAGTRVRCARFAESHGRPSRAPDAVTQLRARFSLYCWFRGGADVRYRRDRPRWIVEPSPDLGYATRSGSRWVTARADRERVAALHASAWPSADGDG